MLARRHLRSISVTTSSGLKMLKKKALPTNPQPSTACHALTGSAAPAACNSDVLALSWLLLASMRQIGLAVPHLLLCGQAQLAWELVGLVGVQGHAVWHVGLSPASQDLGSPKCCTRPYSLAAHISRWSAATASMCAAHSRKVPHLLDVL